MSEKLDAWTPRTLGEALGIDPGQVERALDEDVAAGNAVRVSQGLYTFYVPGSLVATLDALNARPVEGERLNKRRARARRIRVNHRVAAIDKRAAEDRKGDLK